ARAAVTRFPEPLCKLRRRLLLSRIVEQDDRRGGIERELAERRGGVFAQFGELDFGESPDARGVIVDDRPDFRAARFSEHDEADFHWRLGNTSRRGRASVQAVLLAFVQQGLAADAQNLRALAD